MISSFLKRFRNPSLCFEGRCIVINARTETESAQIAQIAKLYRENVIVEMQRLPIYRRIVILGAS